MPGALADFRFTEILSGMKQTFRIIWCIAAVGAIITYLFHGFSFSFKPEALTWNEFSANAQAMEHFAERNGIALDDSPQRMAELHKAFDAEVTQNRDFGSSDANSARVDLPTHGWLGHAQRTMSALYQMWLPRRDPPGRHVHHVLHFSAASQLRWTIGLTLALLIAVAAMLTSSINLLERKARA